MPGRKLPRLSRLPGSPALGVVGGRIARQSGRDFQRQIVEAARWYAGRQEAHLVEVPAATVGPPNALRYAPRGGSIDFVGAIRVPGVPVAVPVMFDAKVTASVTFGLAMSDLKERVRFLDQVTVMESFAAVGGLAGFLCLDRTARVIVWLDVAQFAAWNTPQFLATGKPPTEVVIRHRLLPTQPVRSPNPFHRIPDEREVLAGRMPTVPWAHLLRSIPGIGDVSRTTCHVKH